MRPRSDILEFGQCSASTHQRVGGREDTHNNLSWPPGCEELVIPQIIPQPDLGHFYKSTPDL